MAQCDFVDRVDQMSLKNEKVTNTALDKFRAKARNHLLTPKDIFEANKLYVVFFVCCFIWGGVKVFL